jgi:hypothetical protein
MKPLHDDTVRMNSVSSCKVRKGRSWIASIAVLMAPAPLALSAAVQAPGNSGGKPTVRSDFQRWGKLAGELSITLD